MIAKYGVSKRFTSWFDSANKGVGSKVLGPEQTVTGKVQSTLVGVSGKARQIDEERGFSKMWLDVCTFTTAMFTATDLEPFQYYNKALQSSMGKQIYGFYTSTANQVVDVHAEAVRIKEARANKAKEGGETTTHAASTTAPTGAVPVD
jgi:hypothetical protein